MTGYFLPCHITPTACSSIELEIRPRLRKELCPYYTTLTRRAGKGYFFFKFPFSYSAIILRSLVRQPLPNAA